MNKTYLNLFFYWINERTRIWFKRFAGLAYPWTDDPILREYKFTNAFREWDRGTVWCKERLREPYADDEFLFVNIAMYRRYNWIGTAEELGYLRQYHTRSITAKMLDRRNRREQVFTGAHMLCGNLKDDTGYMPPTKVEQVFGVAFPKLWKARKYLEPVPGVDTLQSAFNRFMGAKIPGYGAFIIYEVISDLRWTRYLRDAPDIMTWANPGPGAKRGIQRIYGSNPPLHSDVGFTTAQYIEAMQWLLYISPKYLDTNVPAMEMRDVEHSLCEFDKYMRVKRGEGRPRAKYAPPSEF